MTNKSSFHLRFSVKRVRMAALVITVFYAVLDEWQQPFVPSQEAQVHGVVTQRGIGPDSRLVLCKMEIEVCRTVRIFGGR